MHSPCIGVFLRSFTAHFSIPYLLIILCSALGGSVPVLGQNIKDTNNTVDELSRSNFQVDPSTLRLNFEFTFGTYPGRGLSQPMSIRYSSKVWRHEFVGLTNHLVPKTRVQPIFAKNTKAGWTSSLDIPWQEPLAGGPFDLSGSNVCMDPSCAPPPAHTLYKVARSLYHLPNGSTHEFRLNDTPFLISSSPPTGPYFAVDSSNLRTGNGLMLPDGSRYLLSVNGGTQAQYIDRNGNTLTYTHATKQWTDTLGRTISHPLADTSRGDKTYTLHGIDGSPLTYILKWRHLHEVLGSQYGGVTLKHGDYNFENQKLPGPSLFTSYPNGSVQTELVVCEETHLFDPIVLYQIVLPNDQSYTFSYNQYAEIEKVVYPTGGYERFVYAAIDGISSFLQLGVYGSANRGVVDRYVSVSGNGTDEINWHYAATGNYPNGPYTVTITAPDDTYTTRYLHRGSTEAPYGFDSVNAGKAYDERVYSSDGQMLRRSLTEWTFSGPLPGGNSSARRNPRITKKVELLLDTDGNALAKTITMSYDADLNVIATNMYDHVSIDQTTAQTGAINSIPVGALLRTEERTYLVNDPNISQATRDAYRARNLLALPTQTLVKDGAGNIAALAKYSHDEPAYAPLTYPGGIPGWIDPGTFARGNVTTTQVWNNTTGGFTVTHAQPDQCGNIRKTWDANGNVTEIFYEDAFSDNISRDTFAFATRTESPVPDPSGSHGSNQELKTYMTYDFQTGKVTNTKDANDKETLYAYYPANLLNRLQKITYPDGGETSYEYSDTPGNVFKRTRTKLDAGTELDAYVFFDGMGRPIGSRNYETESSFIAINTVYDALGRVSQVSNPHRPGESVLWTTTEYDALSRVIRVTTPDGAQVITQYSGNQVTITDQAGKRRRRETDALGRLTKVIEDPGGLRYETTYEYDAVDNLRRVIQGAQTRTFVYDSLSRLTSATNPESGTVTYKYDENGNLTEKTDAREIVTKYYYDALDRNTNIEYINGSQINRVAKVYDRAVNGKGRFFFQWTEEGTTRVSRDSIESYDPLGRPLVKWQHFGRGESDWGATFLTQQTYDLVGNIKTVTYPSGRTVNYSYDQAGRLNSFTGNLGNGQTRTYSTITQYHPAGMIERETFGTQTPLYHKKGYNNRLQLGDVRLSTVNDVLSRDRGALLFYYGPDAVANTNPFANDPTNNGNLVRQEHYVPTAGGGEVIPQVDNYTYDALNRISSVVEPNVFTQTYGYDQYGNRRITSATGGVNNYNPTYDLGSNRIIGLSYDAAGNITSDMLTGGTMTYDAENRLLTATAGGGASYTYDANGKRTRRMVSGQATWYVYGIGGELLAEYTAGAAPTAAQQEYGYRNGELLIIAESVSGGVSFAKKLS
jgi:YD repeat-containing protein